MVSFYSSYASEYSWRKCKMIRCSYLAVSLRNAGPLRLLNLDIIVHFIDQTVRYVIDLPGPPLQGKPPKLKLSRPILSVYARLINFKLKYVFLSGMFLSRRK